MWDLTLKPRAYRMVEIIQQLGGYPVTRYALQYRTRFGGWSHKYTFNYRSEALRAVREWEATL